MGKHARLLTRLPTALGASRRCNTSQWLAHKSKPDLVWVTAHRRRRHARARGQGESKSEHRPRNRKRKPKPTCLRFLVALGHPAPRSRPRLPTQAIIMAFDVH